MGSVPRYPVTEGNLTIECSLDVTLNIARQVVTVNITGPAADNSINDLADRVSFIQFNDNRQGNRMMTIRGVLHVTHLMEDDSGEYRCVAFTKAGAKSPIVSKNIKVVRSDEVFIGKLEFDHGTHKIIQPPGVPTTRWMFTVEARPLHLAQFIWKDPRNNIIDHQHNSKYQMTQSDSHIKLLIKDVTVNDMGTYPFQINVVTDKVNKSWTENLILVVNQDPLIDIRLASNLQVPFLKLNKEYDFQCDLKGYPLEETSVKTYIYPCSNFVHKEDCDLKKKEFLPSTKPISTDGNTDPEYHFTFTTTATMVAETNVKIGCSACTYGPRAKCSKKEVSLLVSEFESGFEITALKEKGSKYYEGDDITLKCTASRYKYSKVSWSLDNDNCIRSQQELPKSCLQDSVEENSPHSWIETLQITNVSQEDSGEFICSAVENDGNMKIHSEKIAIFPILTPNIIKSNMNGSTVSLEQGEQFEFVCEVTGDPLPNITWFKDGYIVNTSNTIDITDNSLKIKFLRDFDSGDYSCVAENRGGREEKELRLEVLIGGDSNLALILGCISAAGVLLLIVIGYLIWRICYYKDQIRSLTKAELELFRNGDPRRINDQLDVHEQTDLLPYDKYEKQMQILS